MSVWLKPSLFCRKFWAYLEGTCDLLTEFFCWGWICICQFGLRNCVMVSLMFVWTMSSMIFRDITCGVTKARVRRFGVTLTGNLTQSRNLVNICWLLTWSTLWRNTVSRQCQPYPQDNDRVATLNKFPSEACSFSHMWPFGSSAEFGHSFLYAQQVFQRLQLEQKHLTRVIGEQWYFLWSSSIYQMSDFSRVPPFHRNFLGFLGVVCGLLTGMVCWGGVCVCQFWFAFVFSGHICPYTIVCKPFIYIVALVRYAKCDPVGRCYISIYFAPFTRLSLRHAIAHCSLYGSRIWEICVCACLFW